MQKTMRSGFRGGSILSIAPLVLVLTAATAFAAVPKVVVDAQLAGPTGFNSPQSIAMAPNNTYYVADPANCATQQENCVPGTPSVLAFTNGNKSTVSTPGFTLVKPQALAVDAAGDLFIGGSPADGTGRVIEAMATNGVLNGTVRLVLSGGPIQDVSALAVDSSGTLYIGDDLSAAVYTIAAGGTTPVKLDVAGLPSGLIPVAILKDAAGDLFIADLNSTLYEIPAGAGSAQSFVIPGFVVWGPTGLATDPKGNLYVLTLTSTEATTAQPVPENIIEVPYIVNNGAGALDPSQAFRVPFTGPQNASGIAIDSSGTIYILDYFNGAIAELVYGSPVNLGTIPAGQYGSPVTVNFEINAPFQQGGFKISSRGDLAQGNSAEVTNWANTCQQLQFTDGSNGGPVSPSNPYLCFTQWAGSPVYPGVRTGTVQFYTTGGYVLASIPYYETGLNAASVVYPVTTTKTVGNRAGNPVSLAISGLDQSLYEVDYSRSKVIRYPGPTGTTRNPVDTNPIKLFTPTSVAVNDEGDLYITEANFGISTPGYIVVVPALKGETPYTFNPGGLLQHPVSITFDSKGNLLIGDSGPMGLNADGANPGYIVEVPVGGGPAFKLNTGGTTIIYPQSIAANPYSGDVYVGDDGELTGSDAKVVRIPAGGGNAAVVTPVSDPDLIPAAIAFGPSGQYYLLDQNTNSITIVPPNGGTPYPLNFANNFINNLSAMVVTNSGQGLVVGNSRSNDDPNGGALFYLDGKMSTLNFRDVPRGQQSVVRTANLANVGTAALQLGQPYYNPDINPPYYPMSTTTCASLATVAPAGLCNLDIQFRPTRRGRQTEQTTFQTNGYSPNPVLNLTGRGTRPPQ